MSADNCTTHGISYDKDVTADTIQTDNMMSRFNRTIRMPKASDSNGQTPDLVTYCGINIEQFSLYDM